MAHHQFTNDPEPRSRPPEPGHGKRADEFPMTRGRFIRVIYFAAAGRTDPVPAVPVGLFPGEYAGTGEERLCRRPRRADRRGPRVAAAAGDALGIAYVVGFNVLTWYLDGDRRHREWLIPAGAAGLRAGRRRDMDCCPNGPCSARRSARPIRRGSAASSGSAYFTVLLEVLSHLRWATGGASAVYFCVLWLVPMISSFMFFMFLRDVYQHSNADDGRLTNSRVFFTDPFTRWAVFVYGQDMHIPHHLFPAIPHYRLRDLHELAQAGPCRPTGTLVDRDPRDVPRPVGPADDPGRDDPAASATIRLPADDGTAADPACRRVRRIS